MRDLHSLDAYRKAELERKVRGIQGDSGNGIFKVFVSGRSFFCIASNNGGWDHVSVSPCNKKRKACPTWEEMCAIKDLFFGPEEAVVEYHPPKREYVNHHEYCLHLWRPQNAELPMPPRIFV